MKQNLFERIQQAIEIIKKLDYETLECGKYIVNGDSAYIQPKVEGTITFGSSLYKKYLKIESSKYIVSMGMIPSGTFNANYLYSDISVTGGNEGILTLNALGKAAITLNVNIKIKESKK